MKVTDAIIFAGGKSKRMGTDKSLLDFINSKSLAEYQYKKLQGIFQNVYISTKENKFNFDAKLIFDRYTQSSPMVAIVSIFEHLNVDNIFILAVDTPCVDKDTIETILSYHFKLSKNLLKLPDILVAQSPSGIEPLCGIFSSNVYPIAKKLLKNNQHKLKILLNQCETKTIFFENEKKFLNLNTQSDYSDLRSQQPN